MAVNESLKLRDLMLFSRIRELNKAEISEFYETKIEMDSKALKALVKEYDRCLGFLFKHNTLLAAMFFEEKMIDGEHVWNINGFRTTTPMGRTFIMAQFIDDLQADKNLPVMALLSGEEARRSRNYKAGKLRELSNLEGLTTLRREALTEDEQDRLKKLALKTAGVVGRTGLTVAKGVGRTGLAVGGLLRDKLLG